MITCNHCGKLTYEGFGSCQYCDAPLSSKIGSVVDPKTGAPEQPELPAWLESLRAGERPVGSTGEQLNYTTDDVVDKDALPSWMRPESAEHISADQYAARRSAALSAPNTEGGFSGTITAISLIDEQSLPTWMREDQSAADLSVQRNIAVASLVQPDALPEWMRTTQQPTSPAAPASALLMQSAEPAIPPQGIAANSLIDPQAMPAWMSGQSEPNKVTPAGGNITAGSLVDRNTLPNWLRENGQEQKPVRVEINPPARPGQTAGTNASLAAPSLIDVNALPEWLRAWVDHEQGQRQGYGQKQQGAPMGASAARTFNVPPRVENVRVPSRPRGEIGAREQSEAAANVFASMLGVASPVPNFPLQTPGSVVGSPLPPSQRQPQMGGVEPNAHAQPGVAGPAPMPGYPAGTGGNQGYQGGYAMLGVQQPGVLQQPPGMAMNGQMEPNAKTGKRGFLETIRGWFSR